MPVTQYCLFFATNTPGLCWPSAEWAAWVQAIGSIVGIFIAVYVPARQHRRDRLDAADDQRREAGRLLGILLAEYFTVFRLNYEVAKNRLDPTYTEFQMERRLHWKVLNQSIASLNSFPMSSLPSPESARVLMVFKAHSGHLLVAMNEDAPEELQGSWDRGSHWVLSLDSCLGYIERAIRELRRFDPEPEVDQHAIDAAKQLVASRRQELDERMKLFNEAIRQQKEN